MVLTVLSLAVILISITAFTAYIANKYGQNDKKHGKHV